MFNVGIRLRTIRKKSNLTLDQLAASSGIDRGTISRIELGHVSPRIDTIYLLCQAMDTSLGTFFRVPDPVADAPVEAAASLDVGKALHALSKRNNFVIPPQGYPKSDKEGYWPVPASFWHGLLEVLERFEILVKNSREIIMVHDFSGTLLYVSPPCEAILGFRGAELVGLKMASLIHPDNWESFEAAFTQVRGTDSPAPETLTVEFQMRCKDGSWRWIFSQFTNQMANPAIRAIVNNGLDIQDVRSALVNLPEAVNND